jgi:hypothetical protein
MPSSSLPKSSGPHKLNKLQVFICVEMLMIIVLAVLVYESLVAHVWYTPYLETVVKDWKKGPITEIRRLRPEQECNAETMQEVMSS